MPLRVGTGIVRATRGGEKRVGAHRAAVAVMQTAETGARRDATSPLAALKVAQALC